MFTRIMGKSQAEVSAMGLGCYAIGGPFKVENGKPWGWGTVDDAESIRAIHAGLDRGITLLDTAMAYGCGHSEVVIGQAIKGRRDQVFLATKFGKLIDEQEKRVLGSSIVPDDIRRTCEDSLRRFDTDYIDLFQWHESSGDPADLPGVMAVLDDLVAAGKIRYYGWSTDDVERMRTMAESPRCAAVQHMLHVFRDPHAMLALCDEFDLASINRGPLVMGILTGKFTADSTFDMDDVRHSLGWNLEEGKLAGLLNKVDALRDVFSSDGRTLVQGALAWIWAYHERTIPIPGFKTVAQVEENAAALEYGPLTAVQMQHVADILAETNTPVT